MKNRKFSQDFNCSFYDDLDIIIDGVVEIEGYDPGAPATKFDEGEGLSFDDYKIILTVNSTEITIEGEAAHKIFKAIEVRLMNKMNEYAEELLSDAKASAAIEAYENRLLDDAENMLFKRRAV